MPNARSSSMPSAESARFEAPLKLPRREVEPHWVDYNGHLNMAYYNLLFDQALDSVFARLGIGEAYVKAENASCFTAEIHVTYVQEVVEGDALDFTFQLLDWDAKRLHILEEMRHAEKGYLAAVSEQMCLHVDLSTRRTAPFPECVQNRLAELMQAHCTLPVPRHVGHVIGIPRKA